VRSDLQRGFSDDRRREVLGNFFLFLRNRRHDGVGHVAAVDVWAVILEPALVAPETLLDALGGVGKAGLWIVRLTGGLENHAGVEVQGAIGRIAGGIFRDHDGPGEIAVEIFVDGFAQPFLDPRPERLADVHVLSRYTKAHA